MSNNYPFKEINQRDGEKESCPICFDEVNETCKWKAFHPCGHRTCCECYHELSKNDQGEKLCPICEKVISLPVTLEGIY